VGINLEHRRLNILRTVDQEFIETVVEKRVTLPTNLAELSEIEEDPIVWVGGTPKVANVQTSEDEIIINGYIETSILYISNNDETYTLEKAVFQEPKFEVTLPFDVTDDNLYIKPDVTLTQISAEENEGRSLTIYATLAVKSEIEYFSEVEIAVDVLPTGNTRVNVNKQVIQVQEYITDVNERITVKESFPIIDHEVDFEDQIQCAAMGTVQLIHVLVGDGKVTVDAEMKIQGAYEVAREFPAINVINCEKISIHETFDIPDAKKGMMADIEVKLDNIKFLPSFPDSFEMETNIEVKGKLLQPNEIKTVTEILSESSDIVDSEEKMICLNEQITKDFFSLSIDENIQIDSDINARLSTNYRDALHSSGFVYLTDLQVNDGEVNIKGVLSVKITCERDFRDDLIQSSTFNFDVPIEFSDSVEVPGVFESDKVLADLKINALVVERTVPGRLNVQADIILAAQILRPTSLILIRSAELITPVELDPYALTFYVSSEGDLLTKVARKYRISSEKLAKANGIEINTRLDAGEKIFIPLN